MCGLMSFIYYILLFPCCLFGQQTKIIKYQLFFYTLSYKWIPLNPSAPTWLLFSLALIPKVTQWSSAFSSGRRDAEVVVGWGANIGKQVCDGVCALFAVLGIAPRASYMLKQAFHTELQPPPWYFYHKCHFIQGNRSSGLIVFNANSI